MLDVPDDSPLARLIPRDEDSGVRILRILLLVVLVHAVGVLLVGITQPLLDLHSFRQTQTALSVYWLAQGGPWLAYETPVVGAPWSIPFEFPVYQLVVAGITSLGVPIVIAGRLVSFGFLIGTLWPLHMLYKELRLGPAAWLASAALLLAAPMYAYWSRTFLIETCALFFSALWLALLMRYLTRDSLLAALGATLAGCLGMLAKSTTFPAFGAVGALVTAIFLLREMRAHRPAGTILRRAFMCALAGVLPLVVGMAWLDYSDAVKSANPFGRMLTSASLSLWNFGDMQQKLSAALWGDVVWRRVLPEVLGTLSLLGLALVALAFTARRTALAAMLALVGFLFPFVVFTGLHSVHNYYQVANGIFLLAAVGIGIGRLNDAGWRTAAAIVLAALVAGQFTTFYQYFAPVVTRDYSDNRLLRIATLAKEATTPQQSLIVIGDDWASTVPFHAERKALVLAPWFPLPLFEQVFADPQAFLGERPLGGIVHCRSELPLYKERIPAIEAFVKDRAVLGSAGGCELLSPDQRPSEPSAAPTGG